MSDFPGDGLTRSERRDLTVESAIRMIDSFPTDDLIDLLIDRSPEAATRAHDAGRSLFALRQALVAVKPRPTETTHYPGDWL